MSNTERVFLTPEQAVAMLPDGDTIHTFRNPSGLFIATDWSRERILEAINSEDGQPQLAGHLATILGHGLALLVDGEPLFVETRQGD